MFGLGLRRQRPRTPSDAAADLESKALGRPPPPPPVGISVPTPTAAGYDRETPMVSLELASDRISLVEAELKRQGARHLEDLSTIDEKYKAAEAQVGEC